MAENTSIAWTDHTINFWWGCVKIDPACTNCYATDTAKRYGDDIWGKDKPCRWIKSAVTDLRKLDKKAREAGRNDKVFVQSMADFFEDDTGQPIVDHVGRQLFTINGDSAFTESEYPKCRPLTMTDMRRVAFAEMDASTNLTYLLLTKRPENIIRFWAMTPGIPVNLDERDLLTVRPTELMYRPNIWLGCSAGTQKTADKAIPELIKCRDLAPVLFVSAEPLLEEVSLMPFWDAGLYGDGTLNRCGPDWVIAGGESGPKARECHIEWIESIVDQCKATGAAAFVKQIGKRPVYWDDGGITGNEQYATYWATDPKGGKMEEWPKQLRVQEFPR